MSNHKYGKLLLTKRSANFLPNEDQMRKDFGSASKKPKLDVRLSQTSVSSSSMIVTNDNFRSVSRKTKLDVRLSQTSTSRTETNGPVTANNEASFDDLWGEDLSEEAIEECLFLASQVCPEVNTMVTSTTSKHKVPQNASTAQNVSVTNLSRSSSEGLFKVPVQISKSSSFLSNSKSKHSSLSTSSRDFMTKQTANVQPPRINTSINLHSSSESINVVPNKINSVNNSTAKSHDTEPLIEEVKRLQLENETIKDMSVTREGEVSILRQQLKQMQMQLETQRVENINKMDIQAQKFKEQLNENKKELEMTNTQLQFKIMEATTMRNHCKLLESNTKIKLVEPQRSTVTDMNRTRGDRFSESILPSDISPPKLSTFSRSRGQASSSLRSLVSDQSVKLRSCKVLQNEESKLMTGAREGSVLGVSVNEFLFKKSIPEVSWILYIRKKQSLCRRIKEAEDINSTILSLQLNDRTLESCYPAVNRLIAMDSLSSPIAKPYIEKVVRECQEIVCRQMHILRLLLQVQSKTERVLLSEEIASSIGTLAVKRDGRLMHAGQWYDEEEGVESRRALGLLSVICNISHLAAKLITGAVTLTNKTKDDDQIPLLENPAPTERTESPMCTVDLESSNLGKKKSKHTESNSSSEAIMETDSMSQESVSKFWKCDLKRLKADYSEYTGKPHGFLCLLRDLAFSISIQRRTRYFIGVLTSMMTMLKTVATRSILVEEGLKIMCEIIREVVFACPQVEVVLALFELLAVLAPYTDIMNTLCHNCESTALVDKRYINLSYFSRDSCVAQVLFRLLPKCETSLTLRTDLCSYMVQWLYGTVCIPLQETIWLLSLQEDEIRTCNCKQKLTQGLVTTLYHSVCDFEYALVKRDALEWELRRVLVMGIMLLRNLLQREFGLYFESAEEEYQLLISKMQKVVDQLELKPMQRECLIDLLKIEESNDDVKIDIQEPCLNYWQECSAQCKTLLSKQAPSHRHQTRKSKRSIAQINKAWNVAV